MKVRIQHITRYHYMAPVFLEPHVLRLIPRPDRYVRVLSRSVTIRPEPAGRTEILENDGTIATFVWFEGMIQTLEIEATAQVQTEPFDPFDFLIYPASSLQLPMLYPQPWAVLLEPYRKNTADSAEVATFAQDLAKTCDHDLLATLTALCRTVRSDFQYEKRPSGSPHAPIQTLAEHKGSCRDFVVLAMAACRQLGLACRYVSGYHLSEADDEPGELHAWMEVFLPGAGWRGFDPTHGMACDHHHLALSASSDPAMTMPVTGSFRGQTSSRMQVELSLECQK